MPKRSSKQGPEDLNESAFRILQEATGEEPKTGAEDGTSSKNPAAVALGRMGGLKGGKARAESLTSEQRSAIAKRAAQARWRSEDKP